MPASPAPTWRRLGAAVALLLAAAAPVRAADPVTLPATPTTITGSETRMISYRHQNHMWQTADGWTHLLANVGPQGDGSALRMFSSPDNGASWSAGLAIGDTDGASTADGILAGNTLHASWAAAGGRIVFAVLQWDPTGRAWRVSRSESVFADDGVKAVNPALARDGVGRFWLGFTTQDAASGAYALKMMRRSSAAQGWVDSGLAFGAPDALSNERSIRPVAVPGGVGAVWSLHGQLNWSQRLDSWAESRAWTTTRIREPAGSDRDPYGSHFSVAVDAGGNVHLAFADASRLWYARKAASRNDWRSYGIAAPTRVAYMQMVVAGRTLMIVTNNQARLSAYQSTDGGASFALTHVLSHAADGADYSNPRNEAPAAVVGGSVPVLQQYVEGGVQRLLSFRVPVLPAATARR